LYINSHSGWAYKVPEKKIVSLSPDRIECRWRSYCGKC
jgi:hypothetical protein